MVRRPCCGARMHCWRNEGRGDTIIMKRHLLIPAIVAAQFLMGTVAESQVFCRFVPERLDDFFWENNYIAMRVYGPALRESVEDSGIDCWLKRVEYPIVDKWIGAFTEGISYHEDRGEGYDPYKVADSAGAGGTAIWLDGRRESLNTFTDWEILESTPEHCRFALTYEKEIDGDVYQERKVISLGMDQRLFKAESTFWKNGELAVGLPIAVGLTTHDDLGTTSSNLRSGWVACWEVIDGDGVGTGVAMDPEKIKAVKIVKGDVSGETNRGHILLIAETDAQGAISYRAGYGWERAGDITSQDLWQAYLTASCQNR